MSVETFKPEYLRKEREQARSLPTSKLQDLLTRSERFTNLSIRTLQFATCGYVAELFLAENRIIMAAAAIVGMGLGLYLDSRNTIRSKMIRDEINSRL